MVKETIFLRDPFQELDGQIEKFAIYVLFAW